MQEITLQALVFQVGDPEESSAAVFFDTQKSQLVALCGSLVDGDEPPFPGFVYLGRSDAYQEMAKKPFASIEAFQDYWK